MFVETAKVLMRLCIRVVSPEPELFQYGVRPPSCISWLIPELFSFLFQFIDLSSAVAMSLSEADTAKSPTVSKPSSSGPTKSAVLAKPNNASAMGSKSTPTIVQAAVSKTQGVAVVNKNPAGATSLISKSADTFTGAGGTTLMVLTTSAVASANQNGTIGVMSSSGTSAPGTLAVKTATSGGGIGGAKTIVVMPVSNSFAAGDGQNAKRFKVE